MPITVVAHTKGGVSKTTIAFNLAAMLARAGARVLLVDADSGQSARKCIEVRSKRDDLTFIACSPMFGTDTHLQLRDKQGDYDEIVMDAGGEGHGADEIRLSLLLAKRLLTPCRPTRADTARLDIMHEMIVDARLYNEELDAMLFPVQASTNARSTDVGDFYVDAAGYPQYRLLDTVVRSRDPYKLWAKTGEAIFEQKRPNKLALAEMTQLYNEVFNG